MPHAPRRRAETNLRQRKPKHQATANKRWLHLSSAETDLQSAIQVILYMMSTFVMAMMQLLALVLATKATADDEDAEYEMIDAAIDLVSIVLVGFLGFLRAVRVTDGILDNIPPEEEAAPLMFTHAKGLRIDDLSDPAVIKMTCFNWSQLCRLYAAFDLEGLLKPMEDRLYIPMGHFNNGSPCCYQINPEEVFLFTLCRL